MSIYNLIIKFSLLSSVPKGPDCHVIPNKTSVTNRTSKSITLNTTRLKNLSEENQLCVQIYSNTSKCNPVGLITMFDDLNSSSNYSFKVFSYYNVSGNGPKVLSEIRCPFGNYYTCKSLVLFISYRRKKWVIFQIICCI